MKPVVVFRTARSEGPGYFATYLERRSIPMQMIAIDEGAALPRDLSRFSGACFMGGAMSVNDALPWIAPVLELIRDAVRKDLPVIGHCLGGQLISKAFGGTVKPNLIKEIGWGVVRVSDNAVAREWLGDLQSFDAFHWHGETFSIPPGATRILENAHCTNQAFALGKHLGMQCHVEMTPDMIRSWMQGGAGEREAAKSSPGVQSPEEVERDLENRVAKLNEVATRLYDKWTENLPRG